MPTLNEHIEQVNAWFSAKGWSPFPFQQKAWRAYNSGFNGIVNAPTGSGKTYSLLFAAILEELQRKRKQKGLKIIWITPIRALAKEIEGAAARALEDILPEWEVGVRHGDTSASKRQKQKKKMPDILVTTPESLHLLLAQKDREKTFKYLRAVVVDEWHELLGSKRGVQVELALSRLRGMNPRLKTWGISATIGNLDEAMDILTGPACQKKKLIKAKIKKQIQIQSLLPETIEKFPWGGHLGITMLDSVVKVIKSSASTLIFTNTRAQAEIWYQRILDNSPDLAGIMAMHHGSISRDLRNWVEDALYSAQLKAVVCTSSLDLGVDFRPVESIVQIGGPKGVARFLQRAGRSGHQPGAKSNIYFVPTHSLELIEAAALREAVNQQKLEAREPYVRSFDVLVQYLVTLAVGGGFQPKEIYSEIKNTHCYASLSEREWNWCLSFITKGSQSLEAYDEFRKVEIENGHFKVNSRKVAYRHRLSMGTIVSDAMLSVKFVTGGHLGSIEEWFISKLKPGDVFWFSGRSLELVRIKDMTVQVRKSKQKTGLIPSWMGGRMPLSSQLGEMLRLKLGEVIQKRRFKDVELKVLEPLFSEQAKRSIIPTDKQLLIEYTQTREGHHLFFYPFEGRFVHEGMGALIAYRIAQLQPISFSIAFSDYGFELLSDTKPPIEEALSLNLFTTQHLSEHIQASVNAAEMARRKFRDIASISGLVFQGYPGSQKKERHLQSSSQLFFDVFKEYEPDNLLYLQAFDEVMTFQLEEYRLRLALERINQQSIELVSTEKPTPFAFPIMVDRLREKLSTEKLEDRVKKMKLVIEKS